MFPFHPAIPLLPGYPTRFDILFAPILPALESSHALAYAAKLAPTLPKDKILLVNLSGRGDKDMHTVAEKSGIVF